MITYLQVENFKSLKKVFLPMERLNLFFGMNSTGKSSMMQALLLLRQSYWTRDACSLKELSTRGELANLGTFGDLLCQGSDEERMRFVARFSGDRTIDVAYDATDNPLTSSLLKISDVESAAVPFAEEEALFASRFCYLAADHIGPRDEYSTAGWERGGVNPLGVHGEYAVPFLVEMGDGYRIPKHLCLETGKTNRLLDQVSAWMSEISPGVRIGARYLVPFERAGLDVTFESGKVASAPVRPVNVGFGVPYVLPLVVSLLTAEAGHLCVIENPESHLHPRGQSKIGELIARAASRGAQIVCESHSDHVINGIRVAVKKGVLRSEDLAVAYFEKGADQTTSVTEISVDANGTLSDYPSGLLDEWGIQMSALL